MFYRWFIIYLTMFVFSLALSGCDFWNDWGVEGAAVNLLQSRLKHPESYKGSSDIVWKGEKDGLKSFVVKVEYVAKNSMGIRVTGCQLLAFVENKDEYLVWNTTTSPMRCEAYLKLVSTLGTMTGGAKGFDLINGFAGLNKLGRRID